MGEEDRSRKTETKSDSGDRKWHYIIIRSPRMQCLSRLLRELRRQGACWHAVQGVKVHCYYTDLEHPMEWEFRCDGGIVSRRVDRRVAARVLNVSCASRPLRWG
jgi:hypothetical protein